MKTLKKLNLIFLSTISGVVLTSCAAGAATAGYSIKAQSADGLSAEAEQRIINRAKMEILAEIPVQKPYASQTINNPVSG